MSADHDDYASEPIRGLPERPPPGESILWQGAPTWWQLSKEAFHIRVVAAYFAALMGWRAYTHLAHTGNVHLALAAIISLLPVAAIGLGLLALMAYCYSRSTVYTITSQRVVIRTGIAITLALNIPFKLIGSAALRPTGGGHGNIILSILGDERIAYGTLWPHVRPWHINKPVPMLRGIANVETVAALLAKAVREALPGTPLSVGVTTIAPTGGHGNEMGLPASMGLTS